MKAYLDKFSLAEKMTICFLMIGVLSISLTAVGMFQISRNTLRSQFREQIKDYIQTASLQIDGDAVDTLRTADDMQSETFKAIRVKMFGLKAVNRGIADVYIMRQDQDGKIFFVIGAALNNDAAKLGDEYTDPGPALAANFSTAKAAFTEDDFYTDQWGTWLSGYAPIRKADGSIVGMIAVDYFAQVVQEKEAGFLQSVWFLSLFSILLMCIAAYFVMRYFFPAPEN